MLIFKINTSTDNIKRKKKDILIKWRKISGQKAGRSEEENKNPDSFSAIGGMALWSGS